MRPNPHREQQNQVSYSLDKGFSNKLCLIVQSFTGTPGQVAYCLAVRRTVERYHGWWALCGAPFVDQLYKYRWQKEEWSRDGQPGSCDCPQASRDKMCVQIPL